MAEWITEEQRARIAELVAEGATSWRLQQETGLSRFAVLRAVRRALFGVLDRVIDRGAVARVPTVAGSDGLRLSDRPRYPKVTE